jgi:hypothetical protein
MSQPTRGILLLINNYDFSKSSVELANRDGTNADQIALQSLFGQLGFDVRTHVYPDLTAKVISFFVLM